MSDQPGAKLKKSIRDAAEQFTRARNAKAADALGELQNNIYPLLQRLADRFAEQDELIGEIGDELDEHEKALDEIIESEGGGSGIEPDLADRLLAHLAAFQGILDQSKDVWKTPDADLPPAMLAGKSAAIAAIAKLETENAALLAAVKEARIEDDAPVVSLVPKPEEDDDEGDGAEDDDGKEPH